MARPPTASASVRVHALARRRRRGHDAGIMALKSEVQDMTDVQPGLLPVSRTVSATALPYAARLDGCLKRQGIRSSIRLCGWPSRIEQSVAAM